MPLVGDLDRQMTIFMAKTGNWQRIGDQSPLKEAMAGSTCAENLSSTFQQPVILVAKHWPCGLFATPAW